MHDLNEVRVYDVSGTTAELVDSAAVATVRGPVHAYAPGFGITAVGVYQISDRSSSDNSLLSDVIEQEVELSGLLTAADIDVTALTQEVKGYRVTGGSVRAALEPLAAAYQFDIIPSGYKLKAVPRGQASVLTVPYADLGATASDTPSDVFKMAREMDSQLPAKTVVKYLDAAREYDIGEQSSTRINTEAVNEVESELALVLGADEAAGIACTLILNRLPGGMLAKGAAGLDFLVMVNHHELAAHEVIATLRELPEVAFVTALDPEECGAMEPLTVFD